jgi:UDP-N-acetylglucosamine 4,6-dehydratase
MSKKILITGGTGSFGNAFLSKIINSSNYSEINIFSRDEKKQYDMRKKFSNEKINFFIGDVRDKDSIEDAMRDVDYVFHAAALKQVPSCEFFPLEAVKTNIIGTSNVLDLAVSNFVKKVVILSTDKAAYPINAMGMSKALMEKVMVAKSKKIDSSKTILCGTRYGNVMASRGSVIPLFLKQIKLNQPLTITDGSMTRFMMNLSNAVELVEYAIQNGNQGEIFVQKSPAVEIKTLAEALIELYNSKSKIIQIGIRHGEKMHETLITKEEMLLAKDLGNYYRICTDDRGLNYDKYFSSGNKRKIVEDYSSNNTKLLNKEEMMDLLKTIPEIKNDLS